MGVKPDHWIIEMSRSQGMIEPFAESAVRAGQVSYGVSSYGYDFRLHPRLRGLRAAAGDVLDPKGGTENLFEDLDDGSPLLPPGSFVLARSLEYFRIPRDVLGLCCGKSTYARCGVLINVTPLEPEWEGYLTVSIVNGGSRPVRLYPDEGIAQLIFVEAASVCRTSYADKKGKYQAQRGIVHARVEEGPAGEGRSTVESKDSDERGQP